MNTEEGADILDLYENEFDAAMQYKAVYFDEQVPLLGIASLVGEMAPSISLNTNLKWNTKDIVISWDVDDIHNWPYPEKTICHNFSRIEHIEEYLNLFFVKNKVDIYQLKNLLPCIKTSHRFENWYNDSDASVHHLIITKSRQCMQYNWMCREKSSLAPVTSEGESLCELRLFPHNFKPLRIYLKRFSSDKILFIMASDKDDQEKSIREAAVYYKKIKHHYI